ncbi:MAG: hypothetical protein AVDCRST_MAG27-4426, partial [uncultured Craurococcus sp.]
DRNQQAAASPPRRCAGCAADGRRASRRPARQRPAALRRRYRPDRLRDRGAEDRADGGRNHLQAGRPLQRLRAEVPAHAGAERPRLRPVLHPHPWRHPPWPAPERHLHHRAGQCALQRRPLARQRLLPAQRRPLRRGDGAAERGRPRRLRRRQGPALLRRHRLPGRAHPTRGHPGPPHRWNQHAM